MTVGLAIARYLLAAHVRTRAFVAPVAAMAVGVVIVYSVEPNPVLSTAGSVATLVFFGQTWLGLAFFATQRAADRWTLAAAAGPWPLACGRLVAGGALSGLVAVAAVAYPVIAGRFDRAPAPADVGICLLATVAASVAGNALSALFAPPLVRNRGPAALGLAACALLTVPLGFPAVSIARALDTTRGGDALLRLLPDLAGIAGLFAAAVVACAASWRRE